MEIIAGKQEFQFDRETAIAIGKFDGVHIGHRRLLREILAQKEAGLKACVFTFEPSPAVFFGGEEQGLLSTREEKRRIFEELGVDVLVEFSLTRESAAMEPEVFAGEILSKALRGRFIAAGEDLSFGRRGEGNAALLERLAPGLGLTVKTIPKVCVRGEEVSSTLIRRLLERGEMGRVSELLGEDYRVSGTVCHGNRIGRTLGFPTVNLRVPEDKLLPPFGVYYSTVLTEGKVYRAISNVGKKPTVGGQEQEGVESFLYDFQEEIYGREISVFLGEFRRPERKFADLEALRKELARDIAAGRDHFVKK